MILSRKGLLAIAAVVDVALHGQGKPVSAKSLADRHALPGRHLEPVLQALVREGILKGVRGPHGGYALGRERRRISADDILRAAGTIENQDSERGNESSILTQVVLPAVAQAQRTFSMALSRITIDDLTRQAEPLLTGAKKPSA